MRGSIVRVTVSVTATSQVVVVENPALFTLVGVHRDLDAVHAHQLVHLLNEPVYYIPQIFIRQALANDQCRMHHPLRKVDIQSPHIAIVAVNHEKRLRMRSPYLSLQGVVRHVGLTYALSSAERNVSLDFALCRPVTIRCRSGADVAVTRDDPLVRHDLTDAHRTARVQFICGNRYFGAQPELPAVVEPRRSVREHG